MGKKVDKAFVISSSFVITTVLLGCLLSSNIAMADDNTVVDNVSVAVPVSCSMSGSGQTSHTATLVNGIYSGAYEVGGETPYSNGIGSTTLSILCNDNSGFSIYTIGFTGETAGDNTLIGTNTNSSIPTGIYTSGDTDSEWSMKVTLGTDSGDTVNHALTIDNSFNNYHEVPDSDDGFIRVAHKDSATDMNQANAATITTTYDAFISSSQPADTYTGKVKYVLVHPYSSTDENAPTISTSLCEPNQLIMQNVSEWKSTVTQGSEVTACDARDGKTYTELT